MNMAIINQIDLAKNGIMIQGAAGRERGYIYRRGYCRSVEN